MITGYNTDVRHNDRVFHVQTEDKGAANPLIESLVYVGGQVLAARRASYSTLLAGGKGEKAVVSLMDRQHRTMIAAIRSGRFDAKVEALFGKQVKAAAAGGARAAPAPPPPEAVQARATAAPAAAAAATSPAPANAPAAPIPAGERSLDQVILEYLTSEAEQEHLDLTLVEATNLALGARAYLVLRATSSRSGQGVPETRVTVKMISTVDEPHNLAQGSTDSRGGLRLLFDIPALERGTAALIITAASDLGRAEIKQLL